MCLNLEAPEQTFIVNYTRRYVKFKNKQFQCVLSYMKTSVAPVALRRRHEYICFCFILEGLLSELPIGSTDV